MARSGGETPNRDSRHNGRKGSSYTRYRTSIIIIEKPTITTTSSQYYTGKTALIERTRPTVAFTATGPISSSWQLTNWSCRRLLSSLHKPHEDRYMVRYDSGHLWLRSLWRKACKVLVTAHVIDVCEGVSIVLHVFHGPSQVSELSICPLDLLQ